MGVCVGGQLSSLHYDHPWAMSQSLPLLASDHVTATKGTGLVHIAPAHGPDDFKLAKKFKIPVVSICLMWKLFSVTLNLNSTTFEFLSDINRKV